MEKSKVSVFWFRRDLRVEDNNGLFSALNSDYPVLPIFIFDTNIIQELKPNDTRISFIYERLTWLNNFLRKHSSGIYVIKEKPKNAWKKILNEFDVQEVHFNEDYEPYAIDRDKYIEELITRSEIKFNIYKDQVVFAKQEIIKVDRLRTRYILHIKTNGLRILEILWSRVLAQTRYLTSLRANLLFLE